MTGKNILNILTTIPTPFPPGLKNVKVRPCDLFENVFTREKLDFD